MNTSNILKIALIVGIAVILIYLIQKCGKIDLPIINDGELEEDAEIVAIKKRIGKVEKRLK